MTCVIVTFRMANCRGPRQLIFSGVTRRIAVFVKFSLRASRHFFIEFYDFSKFIKNQASSLNFFLPAYIAFFHIFQIAPRSVRINRKGIRGRDTTTVRPLRGRPMVVVGSADRPDPAPQGPPSLRSGPYDRDATRHDRPWPRCRGTMGA